MELGLSTSVLGHGALPEGLALLAEHGSPWVEIHGYVPEEFDYGNRALVEGTAHALERYALRLWSCHSPAYRPLDATAVDEALRRQTLAVLRQSLQVAAEDLGARVFVCDAVGPRPASPEERERRLPRFASTIADLLDDAQRLGIRLVIENHSWDLALYGSPAEFSAFARTYDLQELGACWDTGHGLIHGLQPREACALGSRLVTLHLHDNDGRGDRHLLPTEGGVEWEPFVAGLRQIGYGGPFMMELGAPNPPAPAAVRRHLARAVDIYASLMSSV